MNIKGKKRINIVCPKCHYEYLINGDALHHRKMALAEEIEVIKSKIVAMKAEAPNKEALNRDPRYRSLKRRYNEVMANYMAVKNDIKNAADLSELDIFVAFKKKLKNLYGNDFVNDLLKECEEEMQYNDYDMAIQKYNHFDGV